MGLITGFKNSTTGLDIGQNLVEKSYLIDRYPELADTFKQAGQWLWGYNGYGNLGDNSTTNKSSPVQTVAGGTNWKQVCVGGYFNGAIKTDGTLWMWGGNNYGEMGNNTADGGTVTAKSSPIQTIAGGTNWKQMSLGGANVAAIKTDGTLWTWGWNFSGQLGNNTTTSKSSPIQTVAGGTNWKAVDIGQAHIAAIKTDGTLWTWGRNEDGQLGDGTTVDKSSPIQTVAGGTNWKQVAAGGASTYMTAAIKTDGTLWTWGYGVFGQLGDGTSDSKSSPVQTIAGGTNWKQISAGFGAAAIKTDGTLWTWGRNENGGIGDNTTVPKSSPVQTVAGGTNWKQVSTGNGRTAAIKTDGTLWLWGINTYGELGTNDRTQRSSPVQTVAGGTNWKQISAVGGSASAIRDDSADIFGNPV